MPPPVVEPPPRSGFSATDAAFAGLRVARREPLTIAVWALLSLAVFVVFGAFMVATIGPTLMQLQAAQPALGQTPADPAKNLALMGRMAPTYGVLMVLSFLFYGLMFAAVNRAVLRPPGRPGRLGLGADELLQLAVLLLIGVVLFAIYLVGLVALIILAGVVGAAAKPAVALVAALGGIALAATLIYVMVRLSLASPLALDQRKLDLRAAWGMTRGRFWPLLGAYVLAWFVGMVLLVTGLVVVGALAAALGGGLSAAGVIFRPDLSSLRAYFSPAMAIYLVVSSGVYGLLYAIMLGAPADAYRQIAGTTGAAPAPSSRDAAVDRSTAFGTRA